MKKGAYLLFIILLSSSISGCTGEVEEATGEVEEGDTVVVNIDVEYSDVRLEVSNGSEIYEILLKLNHTAAPKHADNFRSHILQGNYDGVDFHRIIDDFMIQAGDFENRDGTGGFAANWYGYCNGDPMADEGNCSVEDYTVPDEVDNGLGHYSCTISMAHAGSNTGGSQFFLIPGDVSHHHWLDGVHTVFGDVVGGCDYVTTLSGTETDYDRPIVPVTISSAEVSEVYIEKVETRVEAGVDLSYVNLSGANLTAANLAAANLTGANLAAANLTGANLSNADLLGANVNSANLTAADLRYADLRYAHLWRADLTGANLSNADLYRANMREADLRYADLLGANLTYADLYRANMREADLIDFDLSNAKLPHANLYDANLTGANLYDAHLTGADLRYADLTGANLSNANVNSANLTGADLRYADLTGADLSNANLTGMRWDGTICPDGTNSDDNGNTCENNL